MPAKSSRDSAAASPLVFVETQDTPLTETQKEFNRLVKQLQTARERGQKMRAKLDNQIEIINREIIPLLSECMKEEIIHLVAIHEARKNIKISSRRQELLDQYLLDQCPTPDDVESYVPKEFIDKLCSMRHELFPELEDMEDEEDEEKSEPASVQDLIREAKEYAATQGLDLDLSDIPTNIHPVELVHIINERLDAAMMESFFKKAFDKIPAQKKRKKRKPTEKQLERQRLEREAEEAKSRNLKSLYKQLAKALHPDLEQDPTAKAHREDWMKRLTSAYSSGNLHEMLIIEMEWLGEEAVNLAHAAEEKLKVYCHVLKEQVAEMRRNNRHIPYEPQYHRLQEISRTLSGFAIGSHISSKASIKFIKSRTESLAQQNIILQQHGTEARKILNRLAEEQARVDQYSFFLPF